MIDKSPRLTIVVPTYNGERTIAATLASIRAQCCTEFRTVFLDDGSTDKTVELIQESLVNSENLVRKQNSGLYDTLNEAVALVETEWVAFLFQDDILDPNYVGRCLAIIEENEASFVWFGINTIDEHGAMIDLGSESGKTELILPGLGAWQSALRRGTFWTISGSLSRASALRNVPFDPSLPHCGDYDFLLRALLVHSFLYIGDPLVGIRIHDGQASTGNLDSGQDIRERLSVLRRAIRQNSAIAPLGLRAELAYRMTSQIVLRSLAFARRGRIYSGLRLAALIPPALLLSAS